MTPAPELARIVGAKPPSRGDAMRKLCDDIKKHDLQDPKNKRRVRADDLLRPVFAGNIA